MGEAQVATPLSSPGEANLQARVTRSRLGPSGDRSHQVNVSLQVHHSHQVQVWFMWERESQGPGETQVWMTVSRSRLRPMWGDQSHRDELRPKYGAKLSCPCEAQVRNRVKMSHRCQVGKESQGPDEA